jgi:hypothetical protein
MARSSVSLLPASVSGPPVVAGRAGGLSETVAGAASGASGDVDAVDAVRGRVVEATLLVGCDLCAAGWDEANREKSSRMLRAASQPDKSNKPTAMLFLTRLIVIRYLNPWENP